MSYAQLHEPDKHWSAIQAALLLLAMVVPLFFSVHLRRNISAEPLTVTLVSAPAPQQQVPKLQAEVEQLRDEIEQTRVRQQEAEIARRQEQQRREEEQKELERQRELEEQKRVEEQRQLEELERQRELEEQTRLEEQKRLEEQRQLEERELEEQKRVEEQRRLEELERERLAADARAAKIKAQRDQQLTNRLIAGIHDRVQRHMADPEGVPTNIAVEILVRLTDNGTLAAVPEVITSSGVERFDQQAVRAIIRGAENGFELPEDAKLREQFGELVLIVKPQGSL